MVYKLRVYAHSSNVGVAVLPSRNRMLFDKQRLLLSVTVPHIRLPSLEQMLLTWWWLQLCIQWTVDTFL